MILLDTNALLWISNERHNLGPRTRERIATDPNVHYSAVSIQEITIKNTIGKLPLPGGQRFPHVFDDMELVELPFTSRHAAAIRNLPVQLSRHDPFDRALLAQAWIERLDFVTGDRVLLALDLPFVVDARV